MNNHLLVYTETVDQAARRVDGCAEQWIDREDVEQEAWLSLVEKHATAVANDVNPAAAAWMIARAAVFDLVRKRPRLRRRRGGRVPKQVVFREDVYVRRCDGASVDDEVLLKGLLEQMSDRERYVLARYLAGGESYAEIAADLGVTESRVCQIVSKAVAAARTFAGVSPPALNSPISYNRKRA